MLHLKRCEIVPLATKPKNKKFVSFFFFSKSDLLKDIPTLDATAGSLGSPFKRPGNNMPAVSKVSIVTNLIKRLMFLFIIFSFMLNMIYFFFVLFLLSL